MVWKQDICLDNPLLTNFISQEIYYIWFKWNKIAFVLKKYGM